MLLLYLAKGREYVFYLIDWSVCLSTHLLFAEASLLLIAAFS